MNRSLASVGFVVAFAMHGQARAEFDYGLYIADDAMLSEVMEKAGKQAVKFRVQDSSPGVAYLLTDKPGHSRIRFLHSSLKNDRKGFLFKLKSIISGVDSSMSYKGECKQNVGRRDAMLRDFVENGIDHSYGDIEERYCIYWFTEDESKPGSKLAELLERHKEGWESHVLNMPHSTEPGLGSPFADDGDADGKYGTLCVENEESLNEVLTDFSNHDVNHKAASIAGRNCVYWYIPHDHKIREAAHR